MAIHFYDTGALLVYGSTVLNKEGPIYVSNKTLEAFSNGKYGERGFAIASAFLSADNWVMVNCSPDQLKDLGETFDWYCLYELQDHVRKSKNNALLKFYTTNPAHAYTAREFEKTQETIKVEVVPVQEKEDHYKGYKVIAMNDEEMAIFYSNPEDDSSLNLLVNQYLILKDKEDKIVDRLVWTGKRFTEIGNLPNIRCKYFNPDHKGFKPKDVYQELAIHSMLNNKITMLKGKPGSGKTMLSTQFLMYAKEHGIIDKIVVFCNPVATVDSAKLGYLPGSKNDKLLDSSVGNMFASKFGSKTEVERMIEDEDLVFLPMSDIRGFDTSGMRAGVYIPEAQNATVNLMKLCLQRIGEDSLCILDGDYDAQVDLREYEDGNNGMRSASKAFRGNTIYGEVELPNIYRSRIAVIADQMH